MSAAAIKKPDQPQMLERLAEAVDIERAPPEAKKLHDQLAASFWTEEDKALGRELGRETQARRAEDRRDTWKEWAIRAFIDNYDSSQYLTRAGILSNLHTDSRLFMPKAGKGGRDISKATINKWLTEDVEAEIRLEGIRRLIGRRDNS